ncbi:unnamed protein product [Leptidea sinapis]|uniref:Retrotransposon gag domain-containing protein n=1 Tax=Leptidea sinapis TaxID=189913 RepID=A0A5E4PYK2_9NEOP|nr:unnamed protein product [Leptidea sinapis]
MPGWQSHPVLISLINSRLSGAAIDAIAYENSLDTWPEVKHALLRPLGETRNEIQVMQELTRMRRLISEDAETFAKRLRDILDTLFTVGKHTDKSYYENMNKRMKPNLRSEEASEDAGGSCKLRFHLEGGGLTGAPV